MNISQKLDNKKHHWTILENNERNILIFTIGNPYEKHGPALYYDNDNRCANFIAQEVCNRTGAKFIANIPYTSDQVGDIALNWSPYYLPMEEFVLKSTDFIKYHCKILQTQFNLNFDNILLINGHGGNYGMKEFPYWSELCDEFETQVYFIDTFGINISELVNSFPSLSEETKRTYLQISPGHADTIEHSIASLYQGVDYGKLYQLNLYINKKGVDVTLKKWPELAGLGGYILFGGDKYEPLRKIKALKNCLNQFKIDKQIYVFPEFAKQALYYKIADICKLIGSFGLRVS